MDALLSFHCFENVYKQNSLLDERTIQNNERDEIFFCEHHYDLFLPVVVRPIHYCLQQYYHKVLLNEYCEFLHIYYDFDDSCIYSCVVDVYSSNNLWVLQIHKDGLKNSYDGYWLRHEYSLSVDEWKKLKHEWWCICQIVFS